MLHSLHSLILCKATLRILEFFPLISTEPRERWSNKPHTEHHREPRRREQPAEAEKKHHHHNYYSKVSRGVLGQRAEGRVRGGE